MKSLLPLVFTALFLVSGCATSRTVSDSAQQSNTLDQLYRETRERPVEVRTRDGQYWTDVRLIQVRPDTVAWIDQSGRRFSAAPRNLASITYRLHAVGLGRGFMGGLGVSAAAAMLTYLLAPDGSGEGFVHF